MLDRLFSFRVWGSDSTSTDVECDRSSMMNMINHDDEYDESPTMNMVYHQ